MNESFTDKIAADSPCYSLCKRTTIKTTLLSVAFIVVRPTRFELATLRIGI